MSSAGREPKTITINNVQLDSETYRALSMRSYHENKPLQDLVSEMLKKHLVIEGFSRNDFDIVHREIIRTLANAIPDETLVEEAGKLGMLANGHPKRWKRET